MTKIRKIEAAARAQALYEANAVYELRSFEDARNEITKRADKARKDAGSGR